MVNVPLLPAKKVTLLALVRTGTSLTVNVKLWVLVPVLLVAVKVIGYVPPEPAAGVPPRMPLALVKATPGGSVPLSLRAGAGKPVAITVKLLWLPTRKLVALALVMKAG